MNNHRWLAAVIVCGVATVSVPQAHTQSVFDKLKQKAQDKTDAATNSAVNSTDSTASKAPADENPNAGSATPGETPGGAPVEATSATATGAPDATQPNPAIKVYQNYDFTPGETILFTDDFTATQDGEFPAQWELTKGQAVVNRQQGFQVPCIDGRQLRHRCATYEIERLSRDAIYAGVRHVCGAWFVAGTCIFRARGRRGEPVCGPYRSRL